MKGNLIALVLLYAGVTLTVSGSADLDVGNQLVRNLACKSVVTIDGHKYIKNSCSYEITVSYSARKKGEVKWTHCDTIKVPAYGKVRVGTSLAEITWGNKCK